MSKDPRDSSSFSNRRPPRRARPAQHRAEPGEPRSRTSPGRAEERAQREDWKRGREQVRSEHPRRERGPERPEHNSPRGPYAQHGVRPPQREERAGPPRHIGPQRRPGTFYLYGINPIARALEVGKRKLYRLWLREGRLSEGLEALQAAMQAHGLPIGLAPVEDLTTLAGSDSHQGAVLECGPLPFGEEAEALALLEPDAASAEGVDAPRKLPLIVVLDQVEDPQNFGAIVRSCAVFGATGVVVPRHHKAPPSPAASKASAGELESCALFEVANLSRFLDACKERGAWTAATVTEGGQPLSSYRRDTPMVLVVGNEGRGMRPLVEKHCDFRLTIPVKPGTSLNVSAATAVALYELTRGQPVSAIEE